MNERLIKIVDFLIENKIVYNAADFYHKCNFKRNLYSDSSFNVIQVCPMEI